MNPYPFYDHMKFTNPTGSTFNRYLYSNPNQTFGFRGGSTCVSKCVTDCNENCGSYCKLSSTDHEQHITHLKKLQEINADLQKQVNTLAYKNLRRRKSTRKSVRSSPRKTPKKYYIQLGTSRKRARSRKRKGGLSFWGSTTDVKPCETDCKSECPYQCKTVCNRATKYTASAEEKSKIDSLLAQNENLRNIISVYT